MLVIYVLSFQGPNGGVTFPMVGVSLDWFRDILQPGPDGQHPRLVLALDGACRASSACLTVVFSVAAGLAFRRPLPRLGRACSTSQSPAS